ncbi:AraC family transcriptional regulator [Runella sp.]|uniref:AraC family transcriptional regulator n=1 Tax=Runella sp. TaxID=1960881 RepID=UPI003D1256CB
MTFYQQQFIAIRAKVFPKDYLCTQVIRAKQFIDSHFNDPIALQDMAKEAYVSKFHFLRLFKLIYGKTPHQYLTEVRIEQAKLFLQTDLSIAEICFAVGFDSVSSFKGLFKRYTGVTPTAYRTKLSSQSLISQSPLRFLPFFLSLKKSNFQDAQPNGNSDLCVSTN